MKINKGFGAFTPMSDDAIDRFVEGMAIEDIALMREQWQKYASPLFDDLIDAGSTAPPQLGSDIPEITVPEIVKQPETRKGEGKTRMLELPDDSR